MKNTKKIFFLLLVLLLLLTSCFSKKAQVEAVDPKDSTEQEESIIKDQETGGTSKEQVAAYIHKHGKLPDYYITKKEAAKLGWEASKGNLWEVAPGKSIGGDTFGNREGLLPDKKGRKWFECDIDYQGGRRGPKRIVFSNDGLIYYTSDHYKTFEEIIINEDPS